MRRRDFLIGAAASMVPAPAIAEVTTHTFPAVNVGSPDLSRITMTMEEFTPGNLAMAFLGEKRHDPDDNPYP